MSIAGVQYASSSNTYYDMKTRNSGEGQQTEESGNVLRKENSKESFETGDTTKKNNQSSDVEDAANVNRGSALIDRLNGKKKAPYSELAKDGIIEYNGVTFVCDDERQRICLGDVSNPKDCLNIPLSGGGSLVVNRDNLGDLANAIGMFSPEDINRIMRAITTDNKEQEMENEIDDDANSLGDAADKAIDNTESEETNTPDLMQVIRDKMKEIAEKIKNGDTEESFQIGGQSFTLEEWDKFLEKFDAAEDAIRYVMEEENAKKNEAVDAEKARVNALVSESTRCSYPAENPDEEKTWYITCYTEQGIMCRGGKQGEMSALWNIDFTESGQYQKVIDFLGKFDQDANLTFANHENFWNDFLTGDIDEEAFVDFYEETNNGIPDYSKVVGDSMYVDTEKVKYAPYFNPLGSNMMSGEEMEAQVRKLIEENQKYLKKL